MNAIVWFSAAFAALICAAPALAEGGFGRAPFENAREPSQLAPLAPAAQAEFELGHALFNTQWVAAGTPRADRRDGLGPLFNTAACDACHNNGARARPPLVAGPGPATLAIRLARRDARDDVGDAHYGRILSPHALDGHAAEGSVTIDYVERSGRYADGETWRLREPRYRVAGPAANKLAPDIVVRPRLAPAVFGVGLIERVPEADLVTAAARQAAAGTGIAGVVSRPSGVSSVGRFGWQAAAVSVRTQTANALALEMGLTSAEVPEDDCTLAQTDCRAAPAGGAPEVSTEFLDALVAFQRALAVPGGLPAGAGSARGAVLFTAAGCDGCHQPAQRAVLDDGTVVEIRPYTDLLLHDLGDGLADRAIDGSIVPTRWRTAPLWGLGYVPRPASELALLHDGRARSVAEAILWHDGEARSARLAFERMLAADRRLLVEWVLAR